MSEMPGSTPFPNHLLDAELPRLRDTEWRVLCVVVRQTLGWRRSDGSRKQSDWIAQSQLKRRTGRSSEALSRAVHRLVSLGLIRVRDQDGHILATPSARRRSRSRLYYSLCTPTPRKSEHRFPNTTKETRHKRTTTTGWTRASHVSTTRTDGSPSSGRRTSS
jgi:hypothetical protein